LNMLNMPIPPPPPLRRSSRRSSSPCPPELALRNKKVLKMARRLTKMLMPNPTRMPQNRLGHMVRSQVDWIL